MLPDLLNNNRRGCHRGAKNRTDQRSEDLFVLARGGVVESRRDEYATTYGERVPHT